MLKSNKHKYVLFYYLIFLLVLAFITYYSSLNYAFQFDDGPSILKFFEIRNLKLNDLLFTSTRWINSWLNTILYSIAKFDPFYYRLTNLFFHLLTSILIFIFTFFSLKNYKSNFVQSYYRQISLFVTSFFLLHPVQTQTVSYIIQGQLEGLSSLFIMSVLLCFLFITKTKNLTKKILIFLFSFLTLLSVGTKEIIIVVPLLLLLINWFFVAYGDKQIFKKYIWLPILNFLLIVTSYFYIKPWFLLRMLKFNYVINNNPGNIVTQNPTDTITTIPFFVSQFKVLLHYLWIYLWPFNISVEYDWKLVKLNSVDFFFPFTIILLVFAIIFYLLKKDKTNLIAFGLIWFFILNLPRASIIPSAELVADYKTYLASYGWLLVISILILKILEKYKLPKLFNIFFISISLSLSILTYQRNKVWQSGIAFWSNIIKNAPNKARAYNNYGSELSKTGKYKESIPFFKKAILLEGQTYYDPYSNLAAAYAVVGDVDLAIETIKKGLQLNDNQPEAYNNLGAFFLYKQELDFAKDAFEKALKLKPHYGKAMYNLAKLYLAQEELEQSWKYFKTACLNSDLDQDLPPWVGYAELSVNLNKVDDARWACKQIIKIAPNTPEAQVAKEILNDL